MNYIRRPLSANNSCNGGSADRKTLRSCFSSTTKARSPAIPSTAHLMWQIPGYWTTNVQESRHKSRHRSACYLDKGHKSAPSWPSVGSGGLEGGSNGAEPNCNSCYHGSSRQQGGAEWSLGRFTTLKFIQKFGGFLHRVKKITIFLFPNISSLIFFYLSPFLSLPLPIQSWSMDCCQETLKSLFSNWQC